MRVGFADNIPVHVVCGWRGEKVAIITVAITGYTGHVYQLQRADDLSGPWETIGPARTGNGSSIIFTDPHTCHLSPLYSRVRFFLCDC